MWGKGWGETSGNYMRYDMAEADSYAAEKSEMYDEEILEEYYIEHNTEEYNAIVENNFKSVRDYPLSTFSVDVDTASYSNVRRMINNGEELPQMQ